MADWRELPAGRDLDRVIAERLGWRVLATEMADHSTGYAVEAPGHDGEPRAYWQPTIDDAWHRAAHFKFLPHYSTDANAALNLLSDTGLEWMLHFDLAHGIDKRVGYSVSIDRRFYREFSETPALAICQAWLSWKESADVR